MGRETAREIGSNERERLLGRKKIGDKTRDRNKEGRKWEIEGRRGKWRRRRRYR